MLKKIGFIIGFIISIAILIIFLFNGWHIEFSENEQTFVFNYKESIVINKPEALLKGNLFLTDGFKLKVTEDDNINPYKIGIYQKKYNASFLFFEKDLIYQVELIDKEFPVITLNHVNNYYTTPGDTYIEEGYFAYDNVDGDITSNVTSYIKDDIVYYEVMDSSGNKTIKTRTINYKDTIIPEITLIGERVILLNKDDIYNEPGYFVVDNIDGNLTEEVFVHSDLDTSMPGIYSIKYFVTDKSNNLATTERIIIIPEVLDENIDKNNEEESLWPEKNGKNIYLTFDDGPSKYTPELLDVLNKYDVKATFFVVNTSHKDMIKRIYEEGHSLGAHSYTHKYSEIYANEEAYFDDLGKIINLIYEQTGVETTLIRFPGGSSNSVSISYNTGIMTRLAKEIKSRGMQYFDWNVSSNDTGGTNSAEEIFNNVISGIGNKENSIVLQHDTKKHSVEAVEAIIVWGLENGYTFLPLDMDSPTSHHKIKN